MREVKGPKNKTPAICANANDECQDLTSAMRWPSLVPLPDEIHSPGLPAFDTFAVRQSNPAHRYCFETPEIWAIDIERLLHHRWINRIDADASWQLYRRGTYKTFNRYINGRCICAEKNGFVTDDAASQSNRAAIVKMVLPDQSEVNLAKQLVVESCSAVISARGPKCRFPVVEMIASTLPSCANNVRMLSLLVMSTWYCPCVLAIWTGSCRVPSSLTTALPIVPVAPMMAIFILSSF